MTISRSSLNSIPTSFATVSVGKPTDSLEEKLRAISGAGFQAIELGFPDLLNFASKYHKKNVVENDYTSLCSAGEQVKKLCSELQLGIMILQPFVNFEGWSQGSKERTKVFEKANGWIKIMQALGTDMLQVGSSDSSKISTSQEELASDLRELADLLAPHNFRLAYENWCWSTHSPTWKQCWQLVQLVDRPNIGLCLDTFQSAGGEYGDPTTASGLIEHFGPLQKLYHNYISSLLELANTVPAEKIYLLQISDAYKPPEPLDPEPDKETGLRPRGRWSKNLRPYPYNGGYLPVLEFAKAVLGTGFRGWFSMECFDGGPDGKGGPMEGDKVVFCKGAKLSIDKLLDDCALTNV